MRKRKNPRKKKRTRKKMKRCLMKPTAKKKNYERIDLRIRKEHV